MTTGLAPCGGGKAATPFSANVKRAVALNSDSVVDLHCPLSGGDTTVSQQGPVCCNKSVLHGRGEVVSAGPPGNTACAPHGQAAEADYSLGVAQVRRKASKRLFLSDFINAFGVELGSGIKVWQQDIASRRGSCMEHSGFLLSPGAEVGFSGEHAVVGKPACGILQQALAQGEGWVLFILCALRRGLSESLLVERRGQ